MTQTVNLYKRFLLITMFALLIPVQGLIAQTSVFINELHYDNTSTDTGEGVELAGPAGTDLTGWSVELYNGNGGTLYNTFSLSGIIPDLCGGYGTISIATVGIQNGSPDGLALIDAGSNVVQFLSYEGTLTAVDGTASGLTSADIGVSEPYSTPIGESLQLTGSGTNYEDFSWSGPVASSFDACNTGQTFGGDGAPSVSSTTPLNVATDIAVDSDIVINFSEDVTTTGTWYDISGSSSGLHTATTSGGPTTYTLDPDTDFDSGETVTVIIYSANVNDNDLVDPPDYMVADYVFSFSTPIASTGWIINELLADPASDLTGDANGDGTRNSSQDEFVEIVNATGATVDISGWTLADGYTVRHTFPAGTVLADQSAVVVFGGGTPTGDFGYALVQTASGGSLGLNNSGDTVTLNDGSSDVVVYAYGSEGGYNQSLTRDPDITGTYPLVHHSTAIGSGGALFSPGTMIDGSPFLGASIPVLWIINELLADPASDLTGDANGDGTRDSSQDEFVEIVNNTGGSVDISGWTIADGYTVRHTFPSGTVLADQSAVIVFGGGTPTGTFGYATVQTASGGSLGLNNSGDTVTLNDGSSDIAVYAYGSEGGNNQSLTRDPDITGADPLVHHSTATGSGGVLFSPGVMIDGSPFPGAVIPPTVYEIFEIQGADLTSPLTGTIVTTINNVVTAVSGSGFFIQTPTERSDANINTSDGIYVFTGSSSSVSVGDLVDVTGEVVEYYDFTELSGATVSIVGTGTLPDPVEFNSTLPSPYQPTSTIEYERFEGMLISIEDGTVTQSNQHFGSDPIAEVYIVANSERTYREPGIEYPGAGGSISVWDINPEVFELDPNKLGLANITINAGSSFDAVGVLGYEYGGYELWPSSLTVNESTLPVAVRDKVDGEFTVGSLNLYRLYDSYSDYSDRIAKFSLYIRNVLKSPDILAVQEVDNLSTLEGLASKIASDDPTVVYQAYLEEGNDIGGIDVGFLVRADRVQVDAITQLGKDETYVDPSDGSVDILHDRPPLLLEGGFIVDTGEFSPITVMVVHNRSLNSIETLRVQTKRLTQAESIAQKIQALQDADPNVNLVVTGDFNAFEFTDGYVDVVGHIIGDFDPDESMLSGTDYVEPNLTNQVLNLPALDRYSYTYSGNAQVLDHALTSVGLEPSITGFEYGRGNADAAENFLDDNSTPLASSDHDGLVLFIDATPPEFVFNDPITLWPVNHKHTKYDISDFVNYISEDGQDIPIDNAYIIKVTSDEPEDADGSGDGNTNKDIKIEDCQTVKLRAERDGTGNGRIYTIYLAVENDNGYTGYGSFQVSVPHSKKDTAVDDGAVYEVYSNCGSQEALGKVSDVNDYEGVSEISAIPNDFALMQNFPNPFNPTTTINYQLPVESNVNLTIYDISGRKVRELIYGFDSAGYKSVLWNGRDDSGKIVSGGIYIYHLKAGSYNHSQKMIFMK